MNAVVSIPPSFSLPPPSPPLLAVRVDPLLDSFCVEVQPHPSVESLTAVAELALAACRTGRGRFVIFGAFDADRGGSSSWGHRGR